MLTRRRFLAAVGAGAVAAALPADVLAAIERAGARAPLTFRSRPDLSPPPLAVVTPARGTAPGALFVACQSGPGERGPMIVDDAGHLVWFRPLEDPSHVAMNFAAQTYRGLPVLTWWQGTITAGNGVGVHVIADASYREVARVHAGPGLAPDLHELVLTPRGTALVTAYQPKPYDLSAIGGAASGQTLLDSIVREIDVASGDVLLDWHASDHIGLDESHATIGKDVFDHTHVNSIDVAPDGNLLVSARHTWALYKVDRTSGDVIWRLGGTKSDFALGEGASFAWQHDARALDDGSITIFDDGAGPVQTEHASRGIRLAVDEQARTATLLRAFTHPERVLAFAEGSMQRLPDGGGLVGWGVVPRLTEFGPEGTVRFDAIFPGKGGSYRARRHEWGGAPADRPALVVEGRRGYVSWNGATAVTHWQILDAAFRPSRIVPRSGFETRFDLRRLRGSVAVEALDDAGHVLARSNVVRL